MHYKAVLFDWMLTLADYPLPADMLRRAAAECGRSLADDEVARLVDGLDRADADPAVAFAMERVDCSTGEHRVAEMLKFQSAGLSTFASTHGSAGSIGGSTAGCSRSSTASKNRTHR